MMLSGKFLFFVFVTICLGNCFCSVLLFFPFQNEVILQIQSVLSTYDDYIINSLSCSEESIPISILSYVNIQSKRFSRALCENQTSLKWKTGTPKNMEEAIRVDLLNFATTSQFDFDVILSAMSTATVIVYDASHTSTMFIDTLSLLLQTNLTSVDFVQQDVNSTLTIQRQTQSVNYFHRDYSHLFNATPPYALSDETKHSLSALVAASKSRINPIRVSDESVCDQILSDTDRTVINHLKPHLQSGLVGRDQSPLVNVGISGNSATQTATTSNKINNNKLLCMVYTISSRHQNVKTQLNTWGHKCDGFIAWSNITDRAVSAVRLHNLKTNGVDSYNEMWSKVQNIWSFIVSSDLITEYQCFYLSGDDVYVIVHNLRRYLDSPYLRTLSNNNTRPLYLGRKVPHNHYLYYNTGESGYILNAVAVRALVFHMKESQCFSEISVSMEDIMVANCLLHSINLSPVDSRDSTSGAERFHTDNLSSVFHQAEHSNRYEGMLKNAKLGLRGISQHSVSFHNMITATALRSEEDEDEVEVGSVEGSEFSDGGEYMRCIDGELHRV